MKSPFASLPSRQVKLLREAMTEAGAVETVEFALVVRPWPPGYRAYIESVYTEPVEYVNLQPVPKPGASGLHAMMVAYLLIAKSLGDQVESTPPAPGADRAAWHAYALAVQAELTAANLTEGDVNHILTEAAKVNNGAGKLGKRG